MTILPTRAVLSLSFLIPPSQLWKQKNPNTLENEKYANKTLHVQLINFYTSECELLNTSIKLRVKYIQLDTSNW